MFKEFLASIYFLKESEDGRKSNIPNSITNYRPILCYKMCNYHCQLDFGDFESIQLGNSYELIIRIVDICPILEGDEFELKEISVIAKGRIICQIDE